MLTLQNARVCAGAGYPAEGKQLGAPPVFIFEPHQPEQCEFKPQVLLDITPVYEIKEKAMESMEAQSTSGILHAIWPSGAARRPCATRAKGIKYAEAYQRVYPQVASEFS
jgi:4-oxalomesaconate hydratase